MSINPTLERLRAKYESEVCGFPSWRGVERPISFESWLVSRYATLENDTAKAISDLSLELRDARSDSNFFEERMAIHSQADRQRITELETENAELKQHIANLEEQVHELSLPGWLTWDQIIEAARVNALEPMQKVAQNWDGCQK